MTDFQDDIEQFLNETFGPVVPLGDAVADQPDMIPVVEVQQKDLLQSSHTNKPRVRRMLKPVVDGNNRFGCKGKRRCLQCRAWRQKCEYGNIDFPCTVCIKHNLPCTAADKVLGTVSRERQHVRMIERSNSVVEIGDHEHGVIEVIPRTLPVPDDMIMPPLELSYIQEFLCPSFERPWYYFDGVCIPKLNRTTAYQLKTHALPKAVRYSVVLASIWNCHREHGPAPLTDWEGGVRTQFYQSMRQSICDQDYGVVARAAGYILLSPSGQLTYSERLKHLEGFATALGLLSKMRAPYEEIVILYRIFLATIYRIFPNHLMSAKGFRDLCNLAIRCYRHLHLDRMDTPISNSLSRVKFCIQIRFLGLLLQTQLLSSHLTEIEYFKSAAPVLLQQFPFDAFWRHSNGQALRDYLKLFHESIPSREGFVSLEQIYPPPPLLCGNLLDSLDGLHFVWSLTTSLASETSFQQPLCAQLKQLGHWFTTDNSALTAPDIDFGLRTEFCSGLEHCLYRSFTTQIVLLRTMNKLILSEELLKQELSVGRMGGLVAFSEDTSLRASIFGTGTGDRLPLRHRASLFTETGLWEWCLSADNGVEFG